MSSRPHPGSERPLHGPLQRFDLGAEVGRLMEEGAWQRGQRNSITLRKGEGMNVVLLVAAVARVRRVPVPVGVPAHEGRLHQLVKQRGIPSTPGGTPGGGAPGPQKRTVPKERPWGRLIAAAVVAAFIVGFAVLAVLDSRQRAGGGGPDGVEPVDVGQAGQHTDADVDYEQSPPAGGEHNPIWQNSGFYEEPVREENAVHTLEHGAVWITYRPDLPQGQKDQIRSLVESQTCMLASPVEGLQSPVVASSWGKQLALESADSPDMEQFVWAYRLGPETPEPGAACTGGTSDAA